MYWFAFAVQIRYYISTVVIKIEDIITFINYSQSVNYQKILAVHLSLVVL